MSARGVRTLRRVLWLAIALLLALDAVAASVLRPADQVSVDEAVERFRAGEASAAAPTTTAPPPATVGTTPAPGAAGTGGGARRDEGRPGVQASTTTTVAPAPRAGTRPRPGVYVYATSGYEETDALGGDRRQYPPETAFTHRHTECGWVMRWQPFKEHWDEWDVCADGPARYNRRVASYREFFGRGMGAEYTCPRAEWLPADRTPGRTWTTRCQSTDGRSVFESVVTVVGVEPVAVGTARVDAVHIRVRNTFTGANEGTGQLDWWCHPETGLSLRTASELDVRGETPIGKVRYHEQVSLALKDLSPRR